MLCPTVIFLRKSLSLGTGAAIQGNPVNKVGKNLFQSCLMLKISRDWTGSVMKLFALTGYWLFASYAFFNLIW
jgi:hypothetical protein